MIFTTLLIANVGRLTASLSQRISIERHNFHGDDTRYSGSITYIYCEFISGPVLSRRLSRADAASKTAPVITVG